MNVNVRIGKYYNEILIPIWGRSKLRQRFRERIKQSYELKLFIDHRLPMIKKNEIPHVNQLITWFPPYLNFGTKDIARLIIHVGSGYYTFPKFFVKKHILRCIYVQEVATILGEMCPNDLILVTDSKQESVIGTWIRPKDMIIKTPVQKILDSLKKS